MVTAAEAAGATTPIAPEYWCDGLLPPLHRPLSLAAGSRRMIPVRMLLLDEIVEPVVPDDLGQPPQVQLRFNGGTQALGAFAYRDGAWTARLDSRQLIGAGTYTVEAVAGDNSYEVQLCEQTITRR